MTEPVGEITAGAAIAIARIEATLDGVKKQIDHQDRTTQQLVKLFEERMMGKFGEVERRLDSMEKAREDARIEAAKDRSHLDNRLRDLERDAEAAAEKIAKEAKAEVAALTEKVERVDMRAQSLENFKAKLVGMMVGVGVVSGGTAAAVAKAIGGI